MTRLSAASLQLSEEELHRLTQTDFALFVQTMYLSVKSSEPLIWAPFLDLICSRLEDIAHGRRRHLIITVPPRSLKSFCVSVCLPAFVLGHYPDEEIMVVSYGQDLARELGEDCHKVMRSKDYQRLFGSALARGPQSASRLVTQKGGVRRGTSIDGVATGVGATLLIVDDPQKPGETLSDAIRRATNAQFERTFLQRRNLPLTARMVIVMQRLHENDFVGHVLDLDKTDGDAGGLNWDVLNMPAIAEQDERISFETCLGRYVFGRKAGEALNPGRLPLTELELIRRVSGEAVWASQYQQRPAPEGGGIVKTAWFKRYAETDMPPVFDRILQSWDTAYTSEKTSDFSCCTTWGVRGKQVYLLHVYRHRLEFHELRKAVEQQAEVHGAHEVLVENKGSGISLIQDLRASGFGLVRGVQVTTDKQTRMRSQTLIIENGFVHIPESAPWLEEFLHELSVFPNGRYDDQVDSVSQALESLSDWSGGRGLFEFMREDAARRAQVAGEVWVMRGPDSIGMVTDRDGGEHYRQPDGCFHLRKEHAVLLLNQIGWSRVR